MLHLSPAAGPKGGGFNELQAVGLPLLARLSLEKAQRAWAHAGPRALAPRLIVRKGRARRRRAGGGGGGG